MKELPDFVHNLRHKASVNHALKRLSEDFAIDESLVLAAAWLGSRGVRPNTEQAMRLALRARDWRDGSPSGGFDVIEKHTRELLLAAGEEFAAPGRVSGEDTMPGWFVLIAPGSVMCLEQSRWLEAVRAGCLQSDA